MAPAILHTTLTHAPWQSPQTARLPGTIPVAPADWLHVDEMYGPQLAERARLIAAAPDRVIDALPEAREAVNELYGEVLQTLAAHPAFEVAGGVIGCPDGRQVTDAPSRPLATLGHLTQEDFCVLQKPEGAEEHVLSAAVLCFPANWTLAQKLGRPLMRIHRPVPEYGPQLGARVQRLFDGIRPIEAGGAILMRMNAVDHATPDLFQTRDEDDPRDQGQGAGRYLRIERQTLRRLPRTGAVIFGIHTAVFDRATLSPDDAAAFAAHADVPHP